VKKLYTEQEWKNHSLKKAYKALKNKIRKRRKDKKKHYLSKTIVGKLENVRLRKDANGIEAPSTFSLIDNIDETLNFFQSIYTVSNKFPHKRIQFDFSGIKNLTTDAILYLLSRMDYLHLQRYFHGGFSGNEPVDKESFQLFQASGFYKYVRTLRADKIQNNPNIYTIESGKLVMASKAKEVKDFIKHCLGKEESSNTKEIYTSIIECMANTRHHAYGAENRYSKWWFMASFDKDRVHFTFLDNGFGIPTTINKKFKEKVRDILGKLLPLEDTDAKLILSALKGDFRTKTKEGYRGKGLPRIYDTVKNKKIENLVIVSRKGFVNVSAGTQITLKENFYGTLLSWDIIK